MREYIRKLKGRTVIFMCFGVALIGISIGLLRLSGFGADPFSCMNLGISSHLPFSYGTYQLIVNSLLFIPMLCFYRNGLGLGTLVNMVSVGYVADFTVWLFSCVNLTAEVVVQMLWLRILLLAAGVCILCFGAALYMECDLGIAPYDALAPMIEKYTGGRLPFKWARVMTDMVCAVVGFVSGAVIGAATVVTAFFTGPLISLFRGKIVNSGFMHTKTSC